MLRSAKNIAKMVGATSSEGFLVNIVSNALDSAKQYRPRPTWLSLGSIWGANSAPPVGDHTHWSVQEMLKCVRYRSTLGVEWYRLYIYITIHSPGHRAVDSTACSVYNRNSDRSATEWSNEDVVIEKWEVAFNLSDYCGSAVATVMRHVRHVAAVAAAAADGDVVRAWAWHRYLWRD